MEGESLSQNRRRYATVLPRVVGVGQVGRMELQMTALGAVSFDWAVALAAVQLRVGAAGHRRGFEWAWKVAHRGILLPPPLAVLAESDARPHCSAELHQKGPPPRVFACRDVTVSAVA